MSSRSNSHILGISPNATWDEIKQAYKAMALKWHPDRHPNDMENATWRFLEIQGAYHALMRERFQYPESATSSPGDQQSVSTYPSSQTKTRLSGSTSTLGSFIHVSASSMESLGPPASAIESTSSYKSYFPEAQSRGRNEPVVVSHPPQYANDDHSRRAYFKPQTVPYGRRHAHHSSENLRQYSTECSGYVPPSLPKYSTIRQSKDSRPFTIIPPAAKKPRKQVDTTTPWDYYRLQEGQQNISLKSLGVGPASEWIYSLTLTLEELLIGKHCSFPLSRSLVSGATKNVILEIDIPPGCRKGTRILCRGVGHEQKDGSRQDIAFIIEELNHDHFSRVGDDLILEVKVPYDDSLRYHGGHFMVGGLDGQKLHFCIDSLRDRAWNGRSIIKGAGMPVRRRGQFVGRGNLVVQWEMIPQQAKVLNILRRFMHFRR